MTLATMCCAIKMVYIIAFVFVMRVIVTASVGVLRYTRCILVPKGDKFVPGIVSSNNRSPASVRPMGFLTRTYNSFRSFLVDASKCFVPGTPGSGKQIVAIAFRRSTWVSRIMLFGRLYVVLYVFDGVPLVRTFVGCRRTRSITCIGRVF